MDSKEYIKKLEDIIAIIPGNIWWKNTQGIYEGCNNNMANIYRLKTWRDIIGKTDQELQKDTDLVQKTLYNDYLVYKHKKEFLFEEEGFDLKGKPATYLTKKRPLFDSSGNFIGLIGTSIDVTKEKEAEKLEQRKVIETLKAVSGSLAHELKTPLFNIDLIMQAIGPTIRSLMHYHDDAQAGRECRLVAQDSIENLKSKLPLIKEQLASAELVIRLQLQSIRDNVVDTKRFSRYSMVEVVNQALTQYPFVDNQRALIHWTDENDFEFWGEVHLMINVLHNLIKNALYFIGEAGKGEIYMTLSKDANGCYFQFKDTGKGMPTEVAAKVFEKFFTRRINGTGLGLAFCQSVMESFKGNIQCQSEEGEYAEFMLSFPCLTEVY